jgi:hypothetical protein
VDIAQHSEVVREDVAIDRLYDLVRNGETSSHEFLQLDELVIDGLIRTYGVHIERGTSLHS